MEIIAPDGIRIAFESEGAGPPLMLLRGFFGDRTTWRSAGYVATLANLGLHLIARHRFLRSDLTLPVVQPFLERATAGGRL